MANRSLSSLSAVRKRNLLVEFSSLKHASPDGVFMSLTPGDPTLWSGVIFVRKGPYAPAILRFQISYPPSYPSLPPLVTFSTDIFHPLITPLTTYLYTTDIQDGGTVSATDEERLPPGGFSLRNGFPSWFGRTHFKGHPTSQPRTSSHNPTSTPIHPQTLTPSPKNSNASVGNGSSFDRGGRRITIYEVLRYIRSAFDDEAVLDLIPLEAAGNPGAWHAWRAHRIKSGAKLPPHPSLKDISDGIRDDGFENASVASSAFSGDQPLASGSSVPAQAKRPGEWNWEGVWEVRAQKGIDTSISESALYGKDAGDDLIRFINLEGDELDDLKKRMTTIVETMELSRTHA